MGFVKKNKNPGYLSFYGDTYRAASVMQDEGLEIPLSNPSS